MDWDSVGPGLAGRLQLPQVLRCHSCCWPKGSMQAAGPTAATVTDSASTGIANVYFHTEYLSRKCPDGL